MLVLSYSPTLVLPATMWEAWSLICTKVVSWSALSCQDFLMRGKQTLVWPSGGILTIFKISSASLDALASLKTMLDINSVTFSRFCHLLSDIDSDCLNSAKKHYQRQGQVLQSIIKYCKVLQSITKYYKVLQSIA